MWRRQQEARRVCYVVVGSFYLQEEIALDCESCGNEVPEFDSDASIVFVAESNRRNAEDLTSGESGALLDKLIEKAGIQDSDCARVWFTKPYRADTVGVCSDCVQRAVRSAGANVVVALGRQAAQYLLDEDAPMSVLRGRDWGLPDTDTPVVVAYHPGHMSRLRNSAEKARVIRALASAVETFRRARDIASGDCQPEYGDEVDEGVLESLQDFDVEGTYST